MVLFGVNCCLNFPFYSASSQINFVLLISRQGKVRLTKWYSPYTQKERTKVSIAKLPSVAQLLYRFAVSVPFCVVYL
jgi:hypothetical protein